MKRRLLPIALLLAVSGALIGFTPQPAGAKPVDRKADCGQVLGGDWYWYIPSGGGPRQGECVTVFGNDYYQIGTYDSSGELQYVCTTYPDGEEVCVVNEG